MNINNVTVAGNLTRDPETKQTPNGNLVTKFSLAVNRKSGEQQETLYIDVECWNKTADLVGQYLHKGSSAAVIGRLKMDSWQDNQTGQNRTKILIVADRVEFGPPQGQQQQGGYQNQQQGYQQPQQGGGYAQGYQGNNQQQQWSQNNQGGGYNG